MKARFMSDPKAVLAEYGIEVPDGIDVNVIENSATATHITMPMAPAGAADLSDEELKNVAGGWFMTASTPQKPSVAGQCPCDCPD